MDGFHNLGSTKGSVAAQLVSSHEDLVGRAKTPSGDISGPRRSEGKSEVSVSTGFSVDEWLLVDDAGYEPCGLLFGVSIFHIGLVGILSGNGEVSTLSSALLQAREIATQRLKAEARAAGATGVVGVRLTIDQLGGKSHLARFTAIGTGVRPKSSAFPTKQVSASTVEELSGPFLTALSGQEFALLLRIGLLPVGLVMGVCVYHVKRLGSLAWMRTYFQSVEMSGYTEALYQARELAMGRIQAEALALNAEGVVGVSTSEQSHVWGSRVIEFFAMGTAISSFGDQEGQIDPKCVLSARDTVVSDPGAILGDDRSGQAR
jgi:uncharacterized protein YbjQ (UPF0145 family)